MFAMLSRGFSSLFGHTHKWSLWSNVVLNRDNPKKPMMGRWRTCEICGKRQFKKSAIVPPTKIV